VHIAEGYVVVDPPAEVEGEIGTDAEDEASP
jgi:hypothetical protein